MSEQDAIEAMARASYAAVWGDTPPWPPSNEIVYDVFMRDAQRTASYLKANPGVLLALAPIRMNDALTTLRLLHPNHAHGNWMEIADAAAALLDALDASVAS